MAGVSLILKRASTKKGKSSQPILVRVVDDLSEGDTQSVINSTTGGPRFGEYALKSLSIELPADAQIKYIESYKFKGDEYKKYVANKK